MTHPLLGHTAIVRCKDRSVHIGRVQYLDSRMVTLLDAVELPFVSKGVSLSTVADALDEGTTTLPQKTVSVIADYTRIVSCTRQLLESAQAIEPLR